MKKARKYFLVALAVILVDQVIKLLVKLNMEIGDRFHVIGDFFKIYFIENEGAAFGLTVSDLVSKVGINMTPETGKLILSVFSILAVVGIGYMLFRLSTHKSPLPLYLAFIFGGAVGNIIDRTFYGLWFSGINNYEGGFLHGRVVDMFYFDIYNGPYPSWVPFVSSDANLFLWPIFNVADAAISIGIVVILIFQGRFFKMHEKATEETQEADNKPKVSIAQPISNQEASAEKKAASENGQEKQTIPDPSKEETS